MFSTIVKEFECSNTDISGCLGQSYDNVSNIAGIYNSLLAKINELSPLATFIPCAAHSLNLVGTAAVEPCSAVCHFFMLIQELNMFFTSSTKRWEHLILQVNKVKTLKNYQIIAGLQDMTHAKACVSHGKKFWQY